MNDERCASYDEETGACTYPKDFRPVACIDGQCTNGGVCAGCNKASRVETSKPKIIYQPSVQSTPEDTEANWSYLDLRK